MAKIKVHEIAKEMEKQSKEIIAFLQDKGIEVKAAQSSLEEEAAEMVRKAFGKAKPAAKPEAVAAAGAKPEGTRSGKPEGAGAKPEASGAKAAASEPAKPGASRCKSSGFGVRKAGSSRRKA